MSSVDYGSIPPFKSLCSGIKSGHITVSNTVLEHPTGYLNPLLSPLLSPSSNMLFALKALLLAGLVAHSVLAAHTPFPARALLPGDGRPLPARAQPNGNGATVSRTVPSYQPALMITGAPQPADEVASAKAAISAAINPNAMAGAATDKEVQVIRKAVLPGGDRAAGRQSDGDGASKSEPDGAKRPLGGALGDPLNGVLGGGGSGDGGLADSLLGGVPLIGSLLSSLVPVSVLSSVGGLPRIGGIIGGLGKSGGEGGDH
ncbi:hypothetical protein GGX14DRAFT_625113 [Mycena pura]|uniref:Uncharacterized protein n=1 Tax=Mycena pura TaxID=153505 RepID=A0AAD6VEX2_9AGAR|nr:hypothetical protein GGX14DRAFT_625113 [Mycena pura]